MTVDDATDSVSEDCAVVAVLRSDTADVLLNQNGTTEVIVGGGGTPGTLVSLIFFVVIVLLPSGHLGRVVL